MDSIVELVKRNEQLLLENAEALNDEEVEQEDIDEYLKIQGATKEELSAFENQFQIRLPEDFKTVYSYKNGSGYMSLIWPQEGFYRLVFIILPQFRERGNKEFSGLISDLMDIRGGRSFRCRLRVVHR